MSLWPLPDLIRGLSRAWGTGPLLGSAGQGRRRRARAGRPGHPLTRAGVRPRRVYACRRPSRPGTVPGLSLIEQLARRNAGTPSLTAGPRPKTSEVNDGRGLAACSRSQQAGPATSPRRVRVDRLPGAIRAGSRRSRTGRRLRCCSRGATRCSGSLRKAAHCWG